MNPQVIAPLLFTRFRFLFLILALLFAPLLRAAEDVAPKQVKLLAIGNSFSNDACYFLPELAKAGGKNLLLAQASLGGHSLDQHVGYLQAYEADPSDPKGSPYNAPGFLAQAGKSKVSLKEILTSQDWDLVTIQQVSSKSYKEETYEPYAGILIDYIHKNAPGAEILIQETWAYRQDHRFFKDGTLTQEKMYDGLKAAYDKLSQHYGLRIIPSGDAIQMARQLPRWTFTFPDPHFDYANPVPENVPDDQARSLNVGWRWITDKETGKRKLELDGIHTNLYGRYLISCVWYEVLFRDGVDDNPFQPPAFSYNEGEPIWGGIYKPAPEHKKMSPEDAAQLRKIAHEAVVARYPEAASW